MEDEIEMDDLDREVVIEDLDDEPVMDGQG